MESMINHELYKVFYLAAKTGSLTQAAKALYITQPSVSHAIKQLEDSFGITLFYRNSKGVALTQEGAILYSYIEQSNILISLAEKKMAELKNLEAGELKIGEVIRCSSTICFRILRNTTSSILSSDFP